MIGELPPAPPAIVQVVAQLPQPPVVQLPTPDFVVEVVAELPLRRQLEDVTRLLGRRQHARSINRTYPPTILELIMLVEPNPAKPNGRAWLSITTLNMGYDASTKEVIVSYCIDYCSVDPKTLALHPKRKMVSYRAPETKVAARVNKKLDKLKKFADRPIARER